MFHTFGHKSFVACTKVAEFTVHLKEGRLVASRCSSCGALAFPPRADCGACRSDRFVFEAISGRGVVYTHTRIDAAPAGFEDVAPYTIVVVDLEEGGRLLGWLGASIPAAELAIGMPVQVVPRLRTEPERVDYTIERMPS